MKKLYLLALAICITGLSAFSQTNGQPRLSPLTRKYISELQDAPNGYMPQGYIYKQHAGGAMYVSSIVKIADAENAQQQLDVIGAIVGTKAGNIWTVQVPVDKVRTFVQLNSIAYIQIDEPVTPNLDVARRTTRVDSVQKGINLPMAYSGKDVVVGVIDFGFDYTHPTFFDTLGTTYRVKRVWELNTNGTPPTGYTYGHEITDSLAMRAQGTDNSQQTHGTAVAGMAAGSGYIGAGNSRFRGMAYEADLVFVGVRRDSIERQWMQGGFSDFVDGINYIFTYAAAQSKPAVVNISWGSQSGAHDGSSLFNQACDNLAGPGKIIVMSAGNDGQEKIHLAKTFTTTDTVLNTFLLFNPANYQRTWVDIWGQQGKTFCASVTLYHNKVAGNSTGIVCIDDSTHSFSIIGNNGTDTCLVEFITSSAEQNNKPRLVVTVFNKTADSVAVSINGTDGTIHAWNEYYYYGYTHRYTCEFDSLKQPWASTGNTAYTVSDMGSAQSVLLVGAYTSKINFTDINGNSWSYGSITSNGQLAPFSSRGPMADGRIKPDITAPGITIATAVSSFNVDYTPTGASSSLVIAAYNQPVTNKKYYYAEFTGTSASAPAASGIVALMLQANPNLSPPQVKEILANTAIKDIYTGVLPAAGNNNWGHGKINAYGAMKEVIHLLGVDPVGKKQPEFVLYPNPNNGAFTLDYYSNSSEQITITLTNVLGSVVTTQTQQAQAGANSFDVNADNLASGIYFVNVATPQGAATVRMVVN